MILIEKKVKVAQFEYLIKKKYRIYGFKKSQFLSNKSSYQSNVDLLLASKNSQPTIRNFDLICEIKTKEELIKHITHQAIIVENENENKKFFLDFLFKNLPLQKTIIKNHHFFIHNFKLINYFKDFLNNKHFENINDFNNYFRKTFNNSFWTIHSIELKEMNQILMSKWGYENTFKFWLHFFKARKNQINDPKNSIKIFNFLIETYKEDDAKLLKFANFFKYLRAKFDEPIINIFEEETKYSIHISVNLKKMVDSFFIDNYLTSNYYDKLVSLTEGLVAHHSLDRCDIFKRRNIINLGFYQNENTLNEKDVKELIIDFFKHLKENHVNINNEYKIDKWITYYYFNKQIPKNGLRNKVIKI